MHSHATTHLSLSKCLSPPLPVSPHTAAAPGGLCFFDRQSPVFSVFCVRVRQFVSRDRCFSSRRLHPFPSSSPSSTLDSRHCLTCLDASAALARLHETDESKIQISLLVFLLGFFVRSQLSLKLEVLIIKTNMYCLSLSNPTPLFNPHIILPHTSKSYVAVCKSNSGFCNLPKWVCNSRKKLANFRNPVFDPRFNVGYLNVGKRVSEACFSFRNGCSLGKVRCGGKNEDVFYMRKCVELAKQAIGCTSPNPMVGCIIVKDDKIVGQGFHPKAGQPHAEVFALREAGEQAENATAYVTLEPCNHHGRTPPCSEAFIKAKVKKVVVGMVDPNPIVSSRGIHKLQEAGIELVVGVEEDSCKKLNEAFIHKMLSGKPFVTLRYSISMNAVILDQLGEMVMECGGYYSQLLQEYDAVIHTSTQIAQESPFLASQEPNARQPLHIFIAKNPDLLYHNLSLPVEANCKAIIFSDKEATQGPELSQKGIETVVMDDISLDAILEYCNRQGMCNVLINLRRKVDDLEDILREGFQTNSVQKVVVEVLPIWAGNEVGLSSPKIMNLMQSKRLKNLLTKNAHDSVLLVGYL